MFAFHKALEIIQEGGKLHFTQYKNCILLDITTANIKYTLNVSRESNGYYQYMLDIGATATINDTVLDLEDIDITDPSALPTDA